jgi:uncharacterized protein YndB with AHSA1/START domain
MPHEFEVREEIELAASPEQVWQAIATGPGIDSWFLGRTEVEPHQGGRARLTLGSHTQESTVTAWEPGKRFAFRSAENPDGTFMAFEYLIEGRDGGSTVLRLAHSGFLGDDWEAEYDALAGGDRMYLGKLATYLTYFPGQTATFSIFVSGPQVADPGRVWAAFTNAVGLTGVIGEGDRGRLMVGGLAPARAVVDYAAAPTFLGVRTSSGIYRFIHGYRGTVVVEQHTFSGGWPFDRLRDDDPERQQSTDAWRAWLTRSFA